MEAIRDDIRDKVVHHYDLSNGITEIYLLKI